MRSMQQTLRADHRFRINAVDRTRTRAAEAQIQTYAQAKALGEEALEAKLYPNNDWLCRASYGSHIFREARYELFDSPGPSGPCAVALRTLKFGDLRRYRTSPPRPLGLPTNSTGRLSHLLTKCRCQAEGTHRGMVGRPDRNASWTLTTEDALSNRSRPRLPPL